MTYASLGFGVTTLHDPSNDSDTVFAAAELQRAGLITAPRIYSTGTILYGAAAPFTANIDSLDDARTHLRRQKALGAISVKSYNQPRREQRQQILAAARETGMMVVPEGGSLFEHNMTMVVDGHTGVEHSIPVARSYGDVRQLWSGTKVGYTPTLIVGYGGVWGENYWYAKTPVWADPRLLAFVPREVIDERARRPFIVPDEEWGHFYNARNTADLAHAGVHVQMGAHGQREGLGAHWEMWMLAQGGLTPHEVLRTGTLSGAEYLGMDKDIGSLEPGKLADIVVLDKNPLDDIRNTESISLVDPERPGLRRQGARRDRQPPQEAGALLLAAAGPRVPRSERPERPDHPGIPPLVECVHQMGPALGALATTFPSVPDSLHEQIRKLASADGIPSSLLGEGRCRAITARAHWNRLLGARVHLPAFFVN